MEEQIKKLQDLVKAYPLQIPLKEVANFLGMKDESLRTAIADGQVPFAFAYSKTKNGNRVNVIPTVPFFMWMTKGELKN